MSIFKHSHHPIMVALYLMHQGTYYAQNYAGIIRTGLLTNWGVENKL